MNFLDEPFRRYYSQHGEDYLLWNFFGFKREGYFIEVGAFDGVYLSNTYSFESVGWKGICIEPIPEMYALCAKNRENSICINAAAGADEQNHEKIGFFQDDMGLYASCVTSEESARFIEQSYENDNISYEGLKKYDVEVRSLNNILETEQKKHQSIDFVSIDVEGFELDVLNGFNLKKYKPTVLLIEANDKDQKKKILDYVLKKGYHFACEVSVNLVFAKDPDDARRLKEIEINCMLEKQLHPKGMDYSIKARNTGVAIWRNRTVFPNTNEFLNTFKGEYLQKLQEANKTVRVKEQHIRKQAENAKVLKTQLEQKEQHIRKQAENATVTMDRLHQRDDELKTANVIIGEKEAHIQKQAKNGDALRARLSQLEQELATSNELIDTQEQHLQNVSNDLKILKERQKRLLQQVEKIAKLDGIWHPMKKNEEEKNLQNLCRQFTSDMERG